MEDNEPMPMTQPGMEGPQDMGTDMGPEEPEMPEPEMNAQDGQANSEIDDIFSKLDTEKQAAVIKYAKSMVDGDAQPEPEMNEEQVVTEITNNIMGDEDKKPEHKEDQKIRNSKITSSNPFITKSFNRK